MQITLLNLINVFQLTEHKCVLQKLITFHLNWKNLSHTLTLESGNQNILRHLKNLLMQTLPQYQWTLVKITLILSRTNPKSTTGHLILAVYILLIINVKIIEDERLVLSHFDISDDMKHYVCMVYKIQEIVTEFIK